MFELAAVTGIDPYKASLRQLLWAAKAKQASDWDHTANLMALIANCNRSPGKKPFYSYQFHPYRTKPRSPITKQGLAAVGSHFKREKVSASEIKVAQPEGA